MEVDPIPSSLGEITSTDTHNVMLKILYITYCNYYIILYTDIIPEITSDNYLHSFFNNSYLLCLILFTAQHIT